MRKLNYFRKRQSFAVSSCCEYLNLPTLLRNELHLKFMAKFTMKIAKFKINISSAFI